ncbi:MAG: NADH-quinone oxidoreductase subunit I [Bdellovibrionales bacterium CG10_big_fil_rev_8_21_14_0_10_45_34]|nr:MAG: NADH-quinone oxidoreductase subunit I [Bdellovibrionales bacterium CG10_big_fil_rev_8_21_14_0_10_45_34]
MIQQLLPVLILFVVVIAFGTGMILLTTLTGFKVRATQAKENPYECGVAGQAPNSTQIPVKFYLTAISFILFDIEIVFLYPWTLIYRETMPEAGLYLLLSMGFFLFVLVFGLFYEWKAKALEWD